MTRPRPAALVGGLLLLTFAGCTTNDFRSTWTEPSASAATLSGRKVGAFVIAVSQPLRRTAEDALASGLTARGARGIAGYTLLTGGEARKPEAARERLQEAGVEVTVALRITAREQQISYFPPTYWGYWGADSSSPYDRTSIKMDMVVWLKARAYSVVQDKILWVGESVAMNHTTPDAFARELGDRTADAVQRAGLLRER